MVRMGLATCNDFIDYQILYEPVKVVGMVELLLANPTDTIRK